MHMPRNYFCLREILNKIYDFLKINYIYYTDVIHIISDPGAPYTRVSIYF